jgi:cell division initiation protein
MSYTPVELRHVRVRRGLLGYKRVAVEQLLLDVADSFEDVWRERAELADEVEELEKTMAELKHREELLTRTLVAAEQAAADVRDAAKRQAELVIAEAHQEARSIARGAQNEHARLAAEVRRMQALLRAALGMVEEAGHEASDDEPEGEARPSEGRAENESWPRRDDTREFARPVRPVPELPSEPEAQAR